MIDGSRSRRVRYAGVLLAAFGLAASAGVPAQCLPEFKNG